MNTFEWEEGTEIEAPYVFVDGDKYYVQNGSYEGGTPVTATNLNKMQNILNDNITNKVEGRNHVSWRNSNPSKPFSAQQIRFNQSMYGASHYEILFLQSTSANRMLSTGKIANGYGTILNFSLSDNYYRAVNDDDTGMSITFEDCITANANGTVVENQRLIPYMVIFHYDNIW